MPTCIRNFKYLGIYIEIEELIICENYGSEGRSSQNYISLLTLKAPVCIRKNLHCTKCK